MSSRLPIGVGIKINLDIIAYLYSKNKSYNFMTGRIEVICGSMFSGKTEELIRRLRRLKYANKSFKVFKPEIDTRNKKNKIKSHGKIKIKAQTVTNAKEILDLSSDFDVIGIDEAQFFSSELVDVCNTLANRGIKVNSSCAQKLEILLYIASEKERMTMLFYLAKKMSMSLFQEKLSFQK